MLRKITAAALMLLTLTACGERVEVPPAHFGIILHTAGYEGDFIPPSRFRLTVCWIGQQCPQIVLISTQDQAITESMDVFLTNSDLQIDDIEVNMRLSVSQDSKTLKAILSRVSPRETEEGYKLITFDEIYRIYAKERIRATVRQAVAEKRLEWLLANREVYSNEVFTRTAKALEAINSPISVMQLSFAKLNPPESMRLAFLKAKEREIALQQAEADKLVSIKKAEAALEVAEKTAAVRLVQAQAFADEAAKMAEAITPEWLQMRRLEVMEAMALNKSAVFFPAEMGVGTAVELQQLKRLDQIADK